MRKTTHTLRKAVGPASGRFPGSAPFSYEINSPKGGHRASTQQFHSFISRQPARKRRIAKRLFERWMGAAANIRELQRNKIREKLMSLSCYWWDCQVARGKMTARERARVCISPLWRHKNQLAHTHVMKRQKLIPFYNTQYIFHLMTSANTPLARAFPESVWITVIIFIVHALVQRGGIRTHMPQKYNYANEWGRCLKIKHKNNRDEKLMDDVSCFVQLSLLFLAFYLRFRAKWHLPGRHDFVIFTVPGSQSSAAKEGLKALLTSSITILSSFGLIVWKLMEVIQMAPAPTHVCEWVANAYKSRKHLKWLLQLARYIYTALYILEMQKMVDIAVRVLFWQGKEMSKQDTETNWNLSRTGRYFRGWIYLKLKIMIKICIGVIFVIVISKLVSKSFFFGVSNSLDDSN